MKWNPDAGALYFRATDGVRGIQCKVAVEILQVWFGLQSEIEKDVLQCFEVNRHALQYAVEKKHQQGEADTEGAVALLAADFDPSNSGLPTPAQPKLPLQRITVLGRSPTVARVYWTTTAKEADEFFDIYTLYKAGTPGALSAFGADKVIRLFAEPLDGRHGVDGEVILAFDLRSGSSIDEFLVVPAQDHCHEWAVPAPLVVKRLRKGVMI